MSTHRMQQSAGKGWLGAFAAIAMTVGAVFGLSTMAQAATSTTTVCSSEVTATNQDSNGWSFFGSGATGHNDFVAGGLHVWTESNNSTDAAVGSRAVNNILLKDAGVPSLNLSDVTGLRPGLDWRAPDLR